MSGYITPSGKLGVVYFFLQKDFPYLNAKFKLNIYSECKVANLQKSNRFSLHQGIYNLINNKKISHTDKKQYDIRQNGGNDSNFLVSRQ